MGSIFFFSCIWFCDETSIEIQPCINCKNNIQYAISRNQAKTFKHLNTLWKYMLLPAYHGMEKLMFIFLLRTWMLIVYPNIAKHDHTLCKWYTAMEKKNGHPCCKKMVFANYFIVIMSLNHEIKFFLYQFFELNLNILSVFYESSLNAQKLIFSIFFKNW